MKLAQLLIFLFGSAVCSQPADAAPPVRDVVFATVDGQDLKLNLFLPKQAERPPLVVFIHGGGWRKGSYQACRTQWLTEHGFAVASVGYRLSSRAKFPAQVHDCKAAVRWLRAHGDTYGYNADRIGVAGTSAGGHLALMMGVTGGDDVLEGDVGDESGRSSRVAAVVDYFGPSDFLLRARRQPVKTERSDSPVRLLLGVSATENEAIARRASPVYHVNKGDPPLLILHGQRDGTVHLRQSERMAEAYRQAGLDVQLEVLPGAGHGGSVFFNEKYQRLVADFLHKHLQQDQ